MSKGKSGGREHRDSPGARAAVPILAVVPLQLLAYHLVLELATNPDTMRAPEPSHARARDAFSLSRKAPSRSIDSNALSPTVVDGSQAG